MAQGTRSGLLDESKAQSVFKHVLLREYILPFAVMTASKLDPRRAMLVDGYAGRGRYDDGKPASAEHLLAAGASPSSTVGILRVGNDAVDLYVLGDTAIYYGAGDQTGELVDSRLAELDIPERQRYLERLTGGQGYDEQHQQLVGQSQLRQRTWRNRPDGFWIAESDPAPHGTPSRTRFRPSGSPGLYWQQMVLTGRCWNSVWTTGRLSRPTATRSSRISCSGAPTGRPAPTLSGRNFQGQSRLTTRHWFPHPGRSDPALHA